jgi:aldehyde:ferredoxin oxidoreductase
MEEGVLTREDVGDLDLKWGNSKAIEKLIEMMVKREGLGHILADGVKQAALRLGKGAEAFAVHAGGQEPAMHDSRNDPGFALHYSVEPTPGRHTIGSGLYYEMFQLWKVVKGLPKIPPFYFKGSKYVVKKEHAKIGAANSKFMNIANASGLCLFGAFLGAKRIRVFEWLNAATGWNKSPEEYMEIGAEIQNLKQSFNIKHGIDPKANRISDRALGMPSQTEGANKGRTIQIEKMISDYWEEFGWSRFTGKPSGEILDRIGSEAISGEV